MNPDEQNYKKGLLFKVIIIVIIAAIFFLWLANLQNVLESRQGQTDNLLQKISDDIDKSLQETADKYNTINVDNSFVTDLVNKASSTSSTTATSTATIKIKDDLTNLIKEATTTPEKSNCPPYINCMPTIGEARPCVIPPGCEKITQIAY